MFEEMILGYKKLKDCSAGQLVRLECGIYLILSEYGNDDGVNDAYISGSGESFAQRNPNEWVAIIDLEWLELNLKDELDYPKSFTTHQISDEKFIHGHCLVAGDDLRHIPTDETNETTLCGRNVRLVSRGMVNATCSECREMWHETNPVTTDS